jgi:hypothetical protein
LLATASAVLALNGASEANVALNETAMRGVCPA